MKILTKEQISNLIGKEVGVSEWLSVSQDQINTFADVTKDHQYIHVDPEKAANTPFGTTIAHGFLSLSMLSYFAEKGCGLLLKDTVMSINYGFDKIRFIQPVKVDSRIRGRAKLLSLEEKTPGKYLFKQEVVVEIDGSDKPALLAQWLTMAIT